MTDHVSISSVLARAYRIPTERPESDGTLQWDSTTLVLATVEGGGKKGVGYTYGHAVIAPYIHSALQAVVEGGNALDIAGIWARMDGVVRNDGKAGIAYQAISAVDVALWDLKAKLLDLPLAELLGRARTEVAAYASGGFTSCPPDRLPDLASQWTQQGFNQVKIKIGRRPEQDVDRVRRTRQGLGETAQLFVDANGAYSIRQALQMAEAFAAYGVRWYEEPRPSRDLDGLHFIRQRTPAGMQVAAGEYGYHLSYFRKMLAAGAVDVLQADVSRCGGITGFLRVAALCAAFGRPFSSHCCPSLHLPAALAVPSFYTLEFFHDHVRIERMLFDGFREPKEGRLRLDDSRPGLGLTWKDQDAEPYAL